MSLFDDNDYEKVMRRMQEEEDEAIRRALSRQQSVEKNEELKKKAKEVQKHLAPRPSAQHLFEEELKDPNEGLPIDTVFRKHLPNTLYYDHYSLSQMYPAFTPDEWRKYMRDNQTFIEGELAAIAEAEARAALSRLGKANGNEVSALKAILEKSKLINDSQKQQTKIVMTFLPPNSSKKETSHNEGN